MEKFWTALWQHHSGKLLGGGLGCLIGVFVILFGFFNTLFVMTCTILGYVVGKRIDERETIVEIIEKLLPPGYRR
ncbi:DUF2273 domain-containing protein [Azotosporobacter soli]|uniref:DUF2273 domain-containing protein n=1 Tax=Azotosporobacter soli TaxID=3055040 RepID=UPI0031FF3473